MQTGMYVALVIIETVFLGRMGCIVHGQQINYISRYRSKL